MIANYLMNSVSVWFVFFVFFYCSRFCKAMMVFLNSVCNVNSIKRYWSDFVIVSERSIRNEWPVVQHKLLNNIKRFFCFYLYGNRTLLFQRKLHTVSTFTCKVLLQNKKMQSTQ